MSKNSPKPGIPSWQIAPAASSESKDEQKPAVAEAQRITRPDGDGSPVSNQPAESDTKSVSDASEVEQVQSFLEDPTVKEASSEKKRTFLEKQGISKATIDQVLGSTSTMSTEFASFRQQTQSNPTSAASTPAVNAAPIITYPEFLVQAHKTPPLITPSRVFNAAYFAAATAALIYGANQFLVTPMLSSLNATRHDFATHSHSKIDDFNERLSKVVSKIPEANKSSGVEVDFSEVESIAADPTDLYHRDTGTQTSPLPSPTSSVNTNPIPTVKKDTVTYHSNSLAKLKEHVVAITDGLQKTAEAEQERQQAVKSLRHELDFMLYTNPGVMMWGQGDDAGMTKNSQLKDDAFEMMKKEIRGVKGVLLSARRFPSARAGA